jgi:hypothetical protein
VQVTCSRPRYARLKQKQGQQGLVGSRCACRDAHRPRLFQAQAKLIDIPKSRGLPTSLPPPYFLLSPFSILTSLYSFDRSLGKHLAILSSYNISPCFGNAEVQRRTPQYRPMRALRIEIRISTDVEAGVLSIWSRNGWTIKRGLDSSMGSSSCRSYRRCHCKCTCIPSRHVSVVAPSAPGPPRL